MADSIWPLPTRDIFAHACGEIAFAAILTGSLAVFPASLRVAEEGGSFLGAWLPLAGLAAALAVAVLFLLRTAGIGVQKAIPNPENRSIALVAVSLWLVLSVVVLAGFGTVLSAVTHHRGLGATTYALVGLGVMGVAGLIAWRSAHLLRSLAGRPPVAWGVFVAACLVLGTMIFAAIRREGDAGNPEMARAVGDAALLAGLAIVTSRIRLPSSQKRFWVPAVVLLLVVLIGVGIAMLGRISTAEARGHIILASPVLDLISKPDTQAKRIPGKRSKPPETVDKPLLPAIAPSSSAEPVVPEPPKRIERPDILLITLDTVRADHIGAYGYARKTSPHIDALAATATVFDRAYAAGPETRTAMAPLVTCKHLMESHRDARSWPTLHRANETVAERLRANGYATGAVMSFQWLSKERGFDQGFDIFDEQPFRRVHPEKEVTGAHAVAQAIEAYDQLTKDDNPVFLWVHMFDAHEQYRHHEKFDFGKEDKDRYDSEIAYMDAELSRLFDHVSKGPRADKAVWIVHGSHGEAFGEHGFRGHPPKVFEEVIRVPLIVKLPWSEPRRVSDAVVSVLDVPATVLSLALGKSDDCSGKSLVPLVEGSTSEVEGRPMLLVAYDGLHGQPPVYAWLDNRVKYMLYAWREGERTRLFDLQEDPGEQQDLRKERAEQGTALRKQLDAHLQDHVRRVRETDES